MSIFLCRPKLLNHRRSTNWAIELTRNEEEFLMKSGMIATLHEFVNSSDDDDQGSRGEEVAFSHNYSCRC